MAKKLFFFITIFICQFYFSQSKALSKIDNLETESEVQNFIRSCSKSKDDWLSEFTLKTIKSFDDNNLSQIIKKAADSLGIDKSFYKGDFDHNGKTDLLFIGDDNSCQSSTKNKDGSNSCDTSVKVIFDMGNTYLIKNLKPNHHDFVIPEILKIDDKDYISVTFENDLIFETEEKPVQNTTTKILTYQFDDFIEYNPEPKKYSVEKIVFGTTGCFGTCPVFTLELNKDGSSEFFAKMFNFTKSLEKTSRKAIKKGEGKFSREIKSEDFEKIENVLNYIDFPNLENDYVVSWTDNQSSSLIITYNNGQIKKIEDYDLVGTYGLKTLYKMLFDLRFNQDWKKKE
ncbi:DUF6438 domain-containing protein [Chryseobacterium tongliaoense]|uniref:DUF6438 domain-containing protein n=1 Tax=Chryseobacterium tongliaoense TaxID=3240933 RepID=UPI0035120E42